MASPVDLFTRDQLNNYVVIDRDVVEKQAKARSLALMSAALSEWILYVQGRFARQSTVSRYMESLYMDITDPFNIVIDVEEGTLAEVLEYGQRSFFMTSKIEGATSTGKLKYKVRPIDEFGERVYLSPKREALPEASMMALTDLEKGIDPDDVSSRIQSSVASFSRHAVSSKSFTPAGQFLPSKATQFRVMKPSDVWKHPGITEAKRALASDYVTTWIRDNRESFTEGMFAGEAMYEW